MNQHEKAWQIFAEMSNGSQKGALESKPNLLTYQLLFKNVRKESDEFKGSSNSDPDKLFRPDDLERVIQLFFQLNAS